jgi:hypothetical protein
MAKHHANNKCKQRSDSNYRTKKTRRDEDCGPAFLLRCGWCNAHCHNKTVHYSLYESHLGFLCSVIPDSELMRIVDLAESCLFLLDL